MGLLAGCARGSAGGHSGHGDHGTDIALFVDGVPVNPRSHAHGQGYADLHFLIPETVGAALKGPYFPEYGDFATGPKT